MNEVEFTQMVQDKAVQVADLLGALTPYERALIWHEAEAIWQERQEQREGETTSQNFEREAALDGVCLWLVEVFRELLPEGRRAVLALAERLADEEQFLRLVGGSEQKE